MAEQKKQNLSDPKVRKRFVTYREATELYSMGLTRVQEHAKIAGATYKMAKKYIPNLAGLYRQKIVYNMVMMFQR